MALARSSGVPVRASATHWQDGVLLAGSSGLGAVLTLAVHGAGVTKGHGLRRAAGGIWGLGVCVCVWCRSRRCEAHCSGI
ncbi:hypothetical protein GQ53DRAFT_749542 [Thozetella sp. PMI_491]|nr:hypothetical protein GQ53DRAFT_749542 [Thozetella sp. PMI_491]